MQKSAPKTAPGCKNRHLKTAPGCKNRHLRFLILLVLTKSMGIPQLSIPYALTNPAFGARLVI